MDGPAQWTLLHELELAARHVLRRRHNPIARATLRRACDHAKASRDQEAAARRLRQSAPQDPRPEPPAATTDPPAPPPAGEELTMRPGYRAPYSED